MPVEHRQGTVCKILARHEVKPHKVRYYLERRDDAFEEKMAEVLCVYREVEVLKADKASDTERRDHLLRREAGHPGHQQHCTRPAAEAGKHATLARDHEYKRHGTLSLFAGIDLLTGKFTPASRTAIVQGSSSAFLERLDAAYPTETAIKLILDNHSAHTSEGNQGVARHPAGGSLHLRVYTEARLLAQPC